MAYFTPAAYTPFGFQPVMSNQTIIQINPYHVSSSEGSAICPGDVVCQTSRGTVRIITGAYTPTSSMATVGVAASYLAANAGSTNATIISNSSQMCLVYDGQGQRFAVCDTTSGVVGTQTGIFKNYAILATGCVGSTGVNGSLLRSVMAVSGATATVAGAFHIVGLHPCESGVFSSAADAATATQAGTRKWIGVFNTGVTHVSTAITAVQNTTS